MTGERTSARELDGLRARLSARDLAILDAVNAHQFLTTRQIMRLHFFNHRTDLSGIRACVRVLGRLHELRILTRLDRVVGGVRAGSSSFVWCLDVLGDRLTRNDKGETRRRYFEPSLTFLGHRLAVAETRLAIEVVARSDTVTLTQLELEPRCWRRYIGRGGETVWLKPDLSAILQGANFDDHWFIEVDRATESFPTLLDKCAQYETYRRSGREQQARGLFPRVLWVMPTVGRARQLRDYIDASGTLNSALFVVITPDQLSETICEPPGASYSIEASARATKKGDAE